MTFMKEINFNLGNFGAQRPPFTPGVNNNVPAGQNNVNQNNPNQNNFNQVNQNEPASTGSTGSPLGSEFLDILNNPQTNPSTNPVPNTQNNAQQPFNTQPTLVQGGTGAVQNPQTNVPQQPFNTQPTLVQGGTGAVQNPQTNVPQQPFNARPTLVQGGTGATIPLNNQQPNVPAFDLDSSINKGDNNVGTTQNSIDNEEPGAEFGLDVSSNINH